MMGPMERTTLVVKLNLKPRRLGQVYSDAYISVKVTITVLITGRAAVPNNRNKKLESCVLFTDCISQINNKGNTSC